MQAVFGSALQVGLCSWCLRKKGPVFVCMFKPLGIAIAAVAGVVFFGDTLYLGRYFPSCLVFTRILTILVETMH